MKTRFLTLISVLIFATIYGCKNSSDIKAEAAIDSTRAFVNRWEQKERNSLLTPEDRKNFTDQWNQLVQKNKTQGVVRAELNEEKIKELEAIYRDAKALNNKMIMQAIQNNLMSRGTNSAAEQEVIEQFDIEF